ncbi:SusC/RagA family TonB-linked outer membrane protein [Sunxiuqinia sp. sy24]|uniref:SusC/RagA family TonB-linked outer membrane protein n=1 Tax=Sunxiuqinia sp. sy24 TaxID=3461495 RepID=UPI004045FAE8
MKKNGVMSTFLKWKVFQFLIMIKVIWVIILASVLQVAATESYSQATKISLSMKDASLEEVIWTMKKMTEFNFFYQNDEIEEIQGLNIEFSDQTVGAILDECLKKTGLTYEIVHKAVIVHKSTAENELPNSLLDLELDNLQKKTITGRVTDINGMPLPGATITIVGTTRGVITDSDGSYSMEVNPSDKLVFSFIGMESQIVDAGNQEKINVKLKEKSEELEDVTVVAFGKQKKESVLASISTIDADELKVPSSNLTTAFAGRIAGLISYQRTGEPGEDNAQFFIRGVTSFGTGKVDPLILIDGVEMTTEDLSRLTTDDIASFSIMKDANATALYGARGANGVVLVTTKEGREGSVKVQFRAEGSFSSPTESIQLSDPVTFMKLHNEAVRTRTPGSRLPYDQKKINYTERGIDPILYPAVNWQDLLFDQNTFNQRYNLNISGGGKIARYYIAASYSNDNGILKVDERQNFNNNIEINKYSLRSNINVNLTNTTEAIVRLSGVFDDYQGPLYGGTNIYNQAVLANPVYFLPYYEPDSANIYTKHILFGNTASGGYLNPYAEMLKGYKSNDRSSMYVQFELKQNLDFLTKGLSARAMFNINRFAQLEVRRQYRPFYYALSSATSNDYMLTALNSDDGTDYLDYVPGGRVMQNTMYSEWALQYNKTIAERHTVSGLLVATIRERKNNTYNTLQLSLPHRNMGLAGRATYSYDDRYYFEANFGYNGSERFAKSERWGFFPSAGLGWIVSNEPFMKPYESFISKLKLKATYGLVGNDEIGNSADRFYYLSELNMSNGGRGIAFGDTYSYYRPGISISRYEDDNITWEISRKSNYGMELNLWSSLEFQFDYFKEKRSNILQTRADIPTTMGLQATPKANIGEAIGSGIELSIDYNKSFTPNLWAVARGNFTYATSKFEMYEEPDYSATPWRLHKGQKLSQRWGYIAERLFLDDEEVKNSPIQTFGDYAAGDIKYKDINKDGRIDENDLVPIGYPTTPEIIYGFGLSLGYKSIDISCFFQGSDRSSFWINPGNIAPFVEGNSSGTTNRALLETIADSHWSEDNRDIYAFWPRLSAESIGNNEVTSTWWMRNGSFLRLKTAEIGYILPARFVQKLHLKNVRFYTSGSNLFQMRKFKLWDPEQAGNAFNYPLQRVINIGVNVEF